MFKDTTDGVMVNKECNTKFGQKACHPLMKSSKSDLPRTSGEEWKMFFTVLDHSQTTEDTHCI